MKSILVVDDDHNVRDVTRLLLESSGYDVLTADSGAAAIARMHEAGERIAAALLDLGLPDASGVDVFHALRELRPGLPVLVASGHSEDEAQALFGDTQPAGYLTKPYRLDELLSRVQSMATQAD